MTISGHAGDKWTFLGLAALDHVLPANQTWFTRVPLKELNNKHPLSSPWTQSPGGFALLSPSCSLPGPVQLCKYLYHYSVQGEDKWSHSQPQNRHSSCLIQPAWKSSEMVKHHQPARTMGRFWAAFPCVPGSPWESLLHNHSAESHTSLLSCHLFLSLTIPTSTQSALESCKASLSEPLFMAACCVSLQHFQGTERRVTPWLPRVSPHSYSNDVQEGLQLLCLMPSCWSTAHRSHSLVCLLDSCISFKFVLQFPAESWGSQGPAPREVTSWRRVLWNWCSEL